MQPFNEIVREHELQSDDWQYSPEAALCHRFFSLFNVAFFKESLPTCFLLLEPAHVRSRGRYRAEANGVGASHQIRINSRYLTLPPHELLAALLHGMLHEEQALRGKPGKEGYHNQPFLERTQELGIPGVRGKRCDIARYTGKFAELLAQEGIAVVETPQEHTIKGHSTQQKWACGCMSVRCGRRLNAQCLTCGQPFTLAE
jgi:hypothetical protein